MCSVRVGGRRREEEGGGERRREEERGGGRRREEGRKKGKRRRERMKGMGGGKGMEGIEKGTENEGKRMVGGREEER